MINRVGGQLVNGQDDVLGPGFGQACLAGMSLNSCSQCMERAGIEGQVQDRKVLFGCRVVIGHSIASPPVRLGQIGYARRCLRPHPLPAIRAGKPVPADTSPAQQVWPGD